MKPPKKSAVISILVVLSLLMIYYVVNVILKQPFYVYLIFLFILIIIAALVFHVSIIAVLGNVNYARGNQEKARKCLEYAIDKKTLSPVAHMNYSIMLMNDGNLDDAFKYLNRAKELNKGIINDKNITVTTATCQWLSGDLDKAIDTIEGLRKKYTYVNGGVLTTLGYLYILKGEFDKASELTEKAMEDMPDYAGAWDNMGQICYRKGDYANAKGNFEKAISLKEKSIDSLYYMGIINESENNPDKAKLYFEKAYACESTLYSVKKNTIKEHLEKYR